MEKNYVSKRLYKPLVEKLALWFTDEEQVVLVDYWKSRREEFGFCRYASQKYGKSIREIQRLVRRGDKYLGMYILWKDDEERRQAVIDYRGFHKYMTNRDVADAFAITVPEVDFLCQMYGNGKKWEDTLAFQPKRDKDEEDV